MTELSGTTRRALLRNSALGMGALVGGAALVTAGATEADAAGSRRQILLTLDGVAGSNTNQGLAGAIALQTISWTLSESIDTLSNHVLSAADPSLLVLTMNPSRASSALLKRLLNGRSSDTGVIRVYHPNVEGVVSLFGRITLTDVRVVGFHQTMSESTLDHPHAGLVDTVRLTYSSLKLEDLDSGTEATYTVPPPP